MDKAFRPLVQGLKTLADAIVAISPNHAPSLTETHGWNQPALNLKELSAFSRRFAADIEDFGIDDIQDEATADLLTLYSERLKHVQIHIVPQMWGSNAGQAVPVYLVTLEGIRAELAHVLRKNTPLDPRAPGRLAKRLTRMSEDLDKILIDRASLEDRVRAINDARETAESLPEDLESLRDAREQVQALADEARKSAHQIDLHESTARLHTAAISDFAKEAEKLVAQCEEAYRVTTSKGLAGAFDQRAVGLSRSMQLWVGALFLALSIAAYLGSQRIASLSLNLAATEPQWGVVAMHFALSILSVGAPLWFAWVATKQIGQRFRLAEDYAYKASVAKACEGYRREAAKIDPEFAARLFGSSLTRLEEAPLRLMEDTSHGSPLHELLSSRKVQAASDAYPEFREKLHRLVVEAEGLLKPQKSAPVPARDTAPNVDGA